MSREVEIEDVQISNLDTLRLICETNKLRWESMSNGRTVARVHDENVGGPTYRRSFDVIKRDNGRYGIVTDNDPRYSSITARFGPDCGTLVRDYSAAQLANKYRNMGGLVRQTVRSDGWVELKVAVGGR